MVSYDKTLPVNFSWFHRHTQRKNQKEERSVSNLQEKFSDKKALQTDRLIYRCDTSPCNSKPTLLIKKVNHVNKICFFFQALLIRGLNSSGLYDISKKNKYMQHYLLSSACLPKNKYVAIHGFVSGGEIFIPRHTHVTCI